LRELDEAEAWLAAAECTISGDTGGIIRDLKRGDVLFERT
jgi:hypothetical protein